MKYLIIALLTSFSALANVCTIADKVSYDIEIANTPEKRQIGLMHRKNMPENAGMLFIWDTLSQRAMWMKNTYIPLDMLFIKNDKILGIIENIEPETLTARYIEQPINKVLELNVGQVQKNNITIGDVIKCE